MGYDLLNVSGLALTRLAICKLYARLFCQRSDEPGNLSSVEKSAVPGDSADLLRANLAEFGGFEPSGKLFIATLANAALFRVFNE